MKTTCTDPECVPRHLWRALGPGVTGNLHRCENYLSGIVVNSLVT